MFRRYKVYLFISRKQLFLLGYLFGSELFNDVQVSAAKNYKKFCLILVLHLFRHEYIFFFPVVIIFFFSSERLANMHILHIKYLLSLIQNAIDVIASCCLINDVPLCV